MKPIKRETTAIAELLAQGAETPEALANLVIEKLDEVRGERTTHSLVVLLPWGLHVYGPFSTASQAEKALAKGAAALVKKAWVAPTTNEDGLLQKIARTDAPLEPKGDWAEVRKDAEAVRNGWNGRDIKTRAKYLKGEDR